MDHEWSTSALAADQVGWDWFALQLDDGHDLMLFQIRQAAGGVADVSSGSRIDPGGRVQPLVRGDVDIEVLDQWTSPRTGAAYPSRWRVRLPRSGLDLTVEPLVSDQELDGSFKYWEGAVTLSGTADGRPVGGRGYVELTGYAPAGEGAGLPGVD
jgi:predicted secreted hydrolase